MASSELDLDVSNGDRTNAPTANNKSAIMTILFMLSLDKLTNFLCVYAVVRSGVDHFVVANQDSLRTLMRDV